MMRTFTLLLWLTACVLSSGKLVAGQEATDEHHSAADEDLPVEARKALTSFQSVSREVHSRAEKEIALRRQEAIKDLDALQNRLDREQKTEQAIAIREKIRELRIAHIKARPNPGSLVRYGQTIGQTFHFQVTGKSTGSVWGTDVYTADSSLAVAAVHAGVLKEGQRGVVRVTVVRSPDKFVGSEKNGVRTMDFGAYPISYRVRRPLPSDTNESTSNSDADADVSAPPSPR